MIVYVTKIRPTPIFHIIMSIAICFIMASLSLRPFLTGVIDIGWIISVVGLIGTIGWVFTSIINIIIFFKNKDLWRIVPDSSYMLEYYDRVDFIHLIVETIEKVSENEYKIYSDDGEYLTTVDTPREFKNLNKAQELCIKNGKAHIVLTKLVKLRPSLIEEVDGERYIYHLFGLPNIRIDEK